MAKGKAVSLNAEDFTEGGGLIDDIDVTFKDCMFDLFDYNGKVIPPVPSLSCTLEDEEGEDVTQYWSMGSAEDWVPSEDGKQLLAIGKATGIRATSNGGIFLKSLLDAGFPADQLGDDISVLDGMQAHVIQVPAPKRKGLAPRDSKFEQTILIIGEIQVMPGEKKAPAGKPKGAAKASAKAKTKAAPKEEPEGGDLNDKATEAIMEILAETGTVTKKELPAKIFATMKADPDRNAIVKLVFDDEFLAAGPWDYEDGTLISG